MAYIIEKIVQRKGDDVALVDERGSTTWRAFNDRVNQTIHAFRAAGMRTGDVVALMTQNRREYFEVMVAAMHNGLVVVPVNWHWVGTELAYVLEDSGARALVVEDHYLPVAVEACQGLEGCPLRWVIASDSGLPATFESFESVLARQSTEEPTDQSGGGPMFYTSGTTGFPKGVRSGISATGGDLALVELVAQSAMGLLGIPTDGVSLLEGPAYHSAQWAFSVFPLLGSASTVVMRRQFDPAELLELIDRHQVTNLHLVPTQFVRLLKLPQETQAAFDGSSLVNVVHGAAPCPPPTKARMIDWWGPVISEYYGGTEGGFLTYVTSPEWLERPGTLGRSTATCELMIINDDGQPSPVGVSGQIYFKSTVGADFEYHNAPEKTEVAHLAPGVGTLGDIGYLDEDGYLFLSDRKIDMIISGGVNIYPAEIEGVLTSHPAVEDAAVFGIPNDDMGEEVKAVVQLTGGREPSVALADELITFVRQSLAGYKAPRTIDFSDSLPRHETGKLYKRLLRDPYWAGTGRSI